MSECSSHHTHTHAPRPFALGSRRGVLAGEKTTSRLTASRRSRPRHRPLHAAMPARRRVSRTVRTRGSQRRLMSGQRRLNGAARGAQAVERSRYAAHLHRSSPHARESYNKIANTLKRMLPAGCPSSAPVNVSGHLRTRRPLRRKGDCDARDVCIRHEHAACTRRVTARACTRAAAARRGRPPRPHQISFEPRNVWRKRELRLRALQVRNRN